MDRLDKIIEEAIVDAHDEDEQFSGWLCILEERVSCPQGCTANGYPALLVKLTGAKGGRGIHALVKLGAAKLVVPIESIELKDKAQNYFLLAYKKWLSPV